LFRETDRKFQETDRKFQETDRKINALERLFTSQWGKLMESLVEGDLVNILNARWQISTWFFSLGLTITFTSDEADTPVARISRSEVPELDGESAWPDTVSHPGPRVIPDLRADPEFRAHPRVSEEDGVRFYAGVPIRSPNGDALGTLSVVDIRPRTLQPSAVEALESLARLVTREMKLRESADLLADVLTRTRILSDVIPVCGDCGRVRRDEDYWEQLEVYLARETGTLLSHGVCPCCTREHYAFLDDED